jgi:hemerythrin
VVPAEKRAFMIAWDPSLETGDAMIDRQHQELYRIVNELRTACDGGGGEDRVDEVLAWLLSYTIEHFAAEEDLMVCSEYPALARDAHVGQHDDLKHRVDELLKQRANGELATAMPVVDLVGEWLGTHINQVDRRFIDHVRSE